GVIDVGLDDVGLRGIDERADVDRAVVAGNALAKVAHLLRHQVDELVVNRLLYIHALHRDASLAGVLHRPEHRRVGGALEVGVGEHDHRVLAAEFERYRGERLRGPFHHGPPDLGRAGEHHGVDVVDQFAPDRTTTDEHLKHVVRNPALLHT